MDLLAVQVDIYKHCWNTIAVPASVVLPGGKRPHSCTQVGLEKVPSDARLLEHHGVGREGKCCLFSGEVLDVALSLVL